MIMLLSLSALLVLVGVFVVQKGVASNWWQAQEDPLMTPAYETPVPTPTLSDYPSPIPTQGPSRR